MLWLCLLKHCHLFCVTQSKQPVLDKKVSKRQSELNYLVQWVGQGGKVRGVHTKFQNTILRNGFVMVAGMRLDIYISTVLNYSV